MIATAQSAPDRFGWLATVFSQDSLAAWKLRLLASALAPSAPLWSTLITITGVPSGRSVPMVQSGLVTFALSSIEPGSPLGSFFFSDADDVSVAAVDDADGSSCGWELRACWPLPDPDGGTLRAQRAVGPS